MGIRERKKAGKLPKKQQKKIMKKYPIWWLVRMSEKRYDRACENTFHNVSAFCNLHNYCKK